MAKPQRGRAEGGGGGRAALTPTRDPDPRSAALEQLRDNGARISEGAALAQTRRRSPWGRRAPADERTLWASAERADVRHLLAENLRDRQCDY